MAYYTTVIVSSLSAGVAAVIGGVRFKQVPKTYRPFIFFCMAAFINDGYGLIASQIFKTNTVNSNIYVLIESMLLLWLFYNWSDDYSRKKKNIRFTIIAILFTIVWLVDNLVMHDMTTINSMFRVVYSFVIVLLSIEQINLVFHRERQSILRNARFIICAAFVIFYTYKTIVEVFFMIDLGMSRNFYVQLYYILVLLNLIINLIYALALLWIPRKQRFSLPF